MRKLLFSLSSVAFFLASLLTARAILSSSSSPNTPLAGYRTVGSIKLFYGNETYKTVNIEDVSPDVGSQTADPSDRSDSRWGMVSALSASGSQPALSPATHYLSVNGATTVEHIGAVDPDGHLITYYYSSDNDWKAVDITEITNVQVAIEQPTSWTAQAGDVLLENIAARQSGGYLYVFTWQAGSDWVATNLSSQLGYYAVSPPTSWNSLSGTDVVEHVAFRNQDGNLILFWRYAGADWGSVNVSQEAGGKKIAGTPTAWTMTSNPTTERIAVVDSNYHLILFTFTPSSGWGYQDVSAHLSGTPLFAGRVTSWDANGTQYMAACTMDNHLVVLSYDSIDLTWSLEDVTSLANNQHIVTNPESWLIGSGASQAVHLVASDSAGNIQHFSKTYLDRSASWTLENVSSSVGVTTPYPLTAWTTNTGFFGAERMAAPTGDGRMQVFTRVLIFWSALDVSLHSAGRVVYAASPFAGIWVSRDYGATWKQSTRPQPAPAETTVPGALNSSQMLDVAVSPTNKDLVFAAADREPRTSAASGAGLYRSTDGGQSWELKYTFTCSGQTQPVTQVLFAPDDPQRVYAAGGCAIARSSDGGKSWTELVPSSTGKVWHLAVSGKTGSADTARTLVACGNGSLWVSTNDGGAWYPDTGASSGLPSNFCGQTGWGHMTAAHVLALAPSNPSIVYLAYPYGTNGPSFYHPQSHDEGPDGSFCNIPVVYDVNNNQVYDSGDKLITRFKTDYNQKLADTAKLKYHDLNSNGVLDDNESVIYDLNSDGKYDSSDLIYRKGTSLSDGVELKDDPKILYVDRGSGFSTRGCGDEASLWQGDISDVIAQTNTKKGKWSQAPSPPTYFGANTPSGGTFVYTHPVSNGYLVFYSDNATVHVSFGAPTVTGWHRMDGTDISEDHRQGRSSTLNFMHVDPQGMAISPGLDFTLKASDQSAPYNMNTELYTCYGSRIWFSNDGGVYTSDDCGHTQDRWRPPFSGLNTLVALNIAGVTSRDYQPALHFGTGDNDDFYSMDDGHTWNTAVGGCGDCDTWFSDLFMSNRVLRLEPRSNNDLGAFGVFTGSGKSRPDAGDGSQRAQVNYPSGSRNYAISSNYFNGFRPVIQTMPSETPQPDGDYITIRAEDTNTHWLQRANDSIRGSGFVNEGPQIPTMAAGSISDPRPLWVQAAGGHTDPYYYLGDGTSLWRAQGGSASWERLPNSKSFTSIIRHFADPYDPSLVYVLTNSGIFRSTGYGLNWQADTDLQAAVTDNGAWKTECSGDVCILDDMVFEPTSPYRRFAASLAGIFFSVDGSHWFRLLDTRALPCRPDGMWFDSISRPGDDTLYVSCDGRGILRLHPIPTAAPVAQTPLPTATPTPTPTPTPHPHGSGKAKLLNGSFEFGFLGWMPSGWTDIYFGLAHSGVASARLGHFPGQTDELRQGFFLPCDTQQGVLSYHWFINSSDNIPDLDTLTVSLEAGENSFSVETLTEQNTQGQWFHSMFDITPLRCQPATLVFSSQQNQEETTNFYLDDVQIWSYDGIFNQYLPSLQKR